MSKTKKVGSTGRYGTRYGKTIRTKVLEVEKKQRKKQKCPHCLRFKVKRVAPGIWLCKKCNVKFAGKAYYV
ncbi:MAG: 50S ribosomal protein L37ae [Candidatus Woesearchaeota archaeon]|jgi:large subunit ribosomal protein L37Ae|nr:50S ribosomal protein L37ae [Candidatus Woesearchaeota archaeon]